MTQKWNLQDIRPADPTKQTPAKPQPRKMGVDIAPRQPQPQAQQQRNFDDSDIASIDVIDGNSSKRNRVIVTTFVGVLIIAAGVAVNVMLGGADVILHPKFKDISVQADYNAYTSPQMKQLGYELLSLESSGERQVKAAGKEKVSLKAEGKIFVYNTKSTQPQRLVKNTRFETKEGLIFRIKESIEVPGATKDAKGELVAGKVAADVISDGTGDQYNISPSRFTVPGLKGNDQFDNVYGESTVSFTGGFEGEKYIIDEKELDVGKQELHNELREKLLTELKDKKPAGFVVYDDAVTLTFDSLPSTEYGESLATIKEVAHLRVPMFKEPEFAKFVAENTIPEYSGDPVTIVDPKTISFIYKGATTTISDISQATKIDFMLKGSARVVWTFDEKKILSELVGRNKSDALTVFKNYSSSISTASSEIRPFWSSKFPSNPDKIKIQTVLDAKN